MGKGRLRVKTVVLTPATNLAYVHVPRTGGEWVKSVFRKTIDSEILNFSLNIKSLDPTMTKGVPAPRKMAAFHEEEARESHLPMDVELIGLMGYPSGRQPEVKRGLKKILSDQEKLETIRFANIRNPYDMLSSIFFRCETFPTWRGFRQFCLNFIEPQPRWHWEILLRNGGSSCKPFGTPADKFLFWWLFDKDGYPVVDFVIRSEKLTTGIRELLDVTVTVGVYARKPGQMVLEDMRMRLLTGNDVNSSRLATSEQLYMFSENSAKPFDDPVRQAIDERFSRECEAFNYDFVGPRDDHTFLDISGLRYHAEEDRLEILYPIEPCEITWKES
jgi:hypothetical protein